MILYVVVEPPGRGNHTSAPILGSHYKKSTGLRQTLLGRIIYAKPGVLLLHWVNNKWGRSQADLMKFTPDDKLRLMGTMLGMEDLKDYIGDLTKATKSEMLVFGVCW